MWWAVCFFSLSKKSGCSLPAFRSWDCLFFLFEIDFRDQSFQSLEGGERKKKNPLVCLWPGDLGFVYSVTFRCVCRLHGNPGQPGLGSWVSNNKHSKQKGKTMLWQLEKSPETCLVFLVYELLVRAEEEMHLLPLLHPGAQPPFQTLSFLPTPSPEKL